MVGQSGQSGAKAGTAWPLPGGRITEIDGLRAIAVAMVFMAHAFPQLIPGGGVGVDVFFVISGYVITRHLLDQSPPLPHFYLNRLIRLFPPLVVVVLFCLVVAAAGIEIIRPFDAVPALLSFMNYARAFEWVAEGGGRLGHYWSLSVEEQFYLLWPFALYWTLRARMDARKVLLATIFAVLAWRLALPFIGGTEDRLYNSFDTRADQLALGCLLNFVPRGWMGRLAWPAMGALAVLAFLPKTDDLALINAAYMVKSLVCFAVVGSLCLGHNGMLEIGRASCRERV